jgi:hypothetical protein
VENVGAALLLAERIVAEADIEDDRILGLGQIGNAEQVLQLEIGDDDGVTLGQDLLGLGDDIAILRHDVLGQLVILAKKGAAAIVVLDGKARALKAVVGEHLVGERQGHRFVIGLAEIMDLDIDRRRRAFDRGGRSFQRPLLLRGGAVAKERKQEQQRRGGTPHGSGRRKRTGTDSALGIHE